MFTPPADVLEYIGKDYQTMREQLIYGKTISIDALVERLKALQEKFRTKLDKPKGNTDEQYEAPTGARSLRSLHCYRQGCSPERVHQNVNFLLFVIQPDR